MTQGHKIGDAKAGGTYALKPESTPVPKKTEGKRPPSGKSARADGSAASSPRDNLDALPHLAQKSVADKHPGHAQQLKFPDGQRYRVGASLDRGSSKTAHDAVRAGAVIKTHYVDLQTVLTKKPGLPHSMTQAEVVKELDLTRRYLDPHAVAGITQDAGVLHSHLIMERLPTSALDAVTSAKPAERGKVATKILRDVAQKLSVMHRDGKVHLDIKPDNIRLNRSGVAMPIDFNSVGDAGSPRGWKPGNPSFRAPGFYLEEAKLDTQVDVHSLGVTGLWLLAGQRGTPFQGYGASGVLEHLQPGLDALRAQTDQPFTKDVLKQVCGERHDASAYLERAYDVSPRLTETIVRDMLGAHPRSADEMARKLGKLVHEDRHPLMTRLSHGFKTR